MLLMKFYLILGFLLIALSFENQIIINTVPRRNVIKQVTRKPFTHTTIVRTIPSTVSSNIIRVNPLVNTGIRKIHIVQDNKCRITGKYSQICSNNNNFDFKNVKEKPYYKCFKNAICASVGGVCQWLQTNKFKECLSNVKNEMKLLQKIKQISNDRIQTAQYLRNNYQILDSY